MPFSILAPCHPSTRRNIIFNVLGPWKRDPNKSGQSRLPWTVTESFVPPHPCTAHNAEQSPHLDPAECVCVRTRAPAQGMDTAAQAFLGRFAAVCRGIQGQSLGKIQGPQFCPSQPVTLSTKRHCMSRVRVGIYQVLWHRRQ